MWVAKVVGFVMGLVGGLALLGVLWTAIGVVTDPSAVADGPAWAFDVSVGADRSGLDDLGHRVVRLGLVDAGAPVALAVAFRLSMSLLLAGGLIWGGKAFALIGERAGLSHRCGTLLVRSGAVLLAAWALDTAGFLWVREGVPPVLAAATDIHARLLPQLPEVGALAALAASMIVIGIVIRQAMPIVEEHELTV